MGLSDGSIAPQLMEDAERINPSVVFDLWPLLHKVRCTSRSCPQSDKPSQAAHLVAKSYVSVVSLTRHNNDGSGTLAILIN